MSEKTYKLPKQLIPDDISVKGLSGFAVTTGEAVNSTSAIDIVTVDVPAGSWSDGEQIEITGMMHAKNLSGGAANLSVGLTINDQSEEVLSNWASSNGLNNIVLRSLRLIRVGNKIYGDQYTGQNNDVEGIRAEPTLGILNEHRDGQNLTYDFSQAITIKIYVQWSVAHADISYKAMCATALKHSLVSS
jgi:hypothetical protein